MTTTVKRVAKFSNVPTTNTGVGAELGLAIRHTKTQETLLTHTNSELQAESGTLHVLGNADIGGVNINSNLPTQSNTKVRLTRQQRMLMLQRKQQKQIKPFRQFYLHLISMR